MRGSELFCHQFQWDSYNLSWLYLVLFIVALFFFFLSFKKSLYESFFYVLQIYSGNEEPNVKQSNFF